MSRATTENDKNVSTNFVATTFENDIGSEEVSGEKSGKTIAILVLGNRLFYGKG